MTDISGWRKRQIALDQKAENAREMGLNYDPERDYERGFIDGMQKQMQSSVDKAVNAMSQLTYYIPTSTAQEVI